MDNKNSANNSIASFIILSVALSASVTVCDAYQQNCNLISDANVGFSVMDNNIVRYAGPAMPGADIMRYAGPSMPGTDIVRYAGPAIPGTDIMRYAGPSVPGADIVRYAGPAIPGADIMRYAGPSVPDVDIVRYAGPQKINTEIKSSINSVNADIQNASNRANINGFGDINVNEITPDMNYVNTKYGVMRVVSPSRHYIFK